MKRQIIMSAVILLALSYTVQAYVVGNYSFEDPGDGKHNNWEEVPFWSSDRVASDSGVESDWPGSTEGVYAGYLMSGDPSVWQLTDIVIEAGKVYTLLVDARDNWSATMPAKLEMMLYYDNVGTRTPVALAIVDLLGGTEGPWETYDLSFVADDVPASIGNQIGIELINVSSASSWIGIDNIQLIPEPMTLTLLGLGGLFLRRRR
ncbi:MAG: PEP-CTERM sorting domain-containing protein [Sedimentisphaerales bacterium]|nr:PEP-CTERM sorting domain-containing protein [Sedimentisphaerales bacterium]